MVVSVGFELFEIEGRGVAINGRGAGGSAWVWRDGSWVWAPGLANKEGVPLSCAKFGACFSDADLSLVPQ